MAEQESELIDPRRAFGAIVSSIEGLRLVWRTSRGLTVLLVLSTIVAGIAPAGAAYVARIVVDHVVAASRGDASAEMPALIAIGVEALLVAAVVLANRGASFCQSLLQVRLAHSVTHMILAKAIELRLSDFENPALNDRMEEARREAAARPLSLVMRIFTLARYGLALAGYVVILIQLSPWAVLALVLAGVPVFVSEARFSKESFRFFRRKSPENRERNYVESLLTREEFAKEIGFFGLGKIMLGRYDELFERLYAEDRRIAVKRHAWGLVLGFVATAAFFGAYAWIAFETFANRMTIGQMTMYLVVFRQGQTAVSSALAALGGVYDDALYLENLRTFLDYEVVADRGKAVRGPDPKGGLRVENLSWTYAGEDRPALSDVSFHVPPGTTLAIVGHNGSGKTTLVKLITRRYIAEEGSISIDGLDLREWSDAALRARVSVLFQDYNKYRFTVGENIGAGDPPHLMDEERWKRAAEQGKADDLVRNLPEQYETRLGKSFRKGHELSGGEWQRLAFARSLMNSESELLIFDEPAAAADPQRQAELDERLREILDGRMGLIVSHRLATARIADRILVLSHGRVAEMGTHEELLAQGGIYAELWQAQSSAYQ